MKSIMETTFNILYLIIIWYLVIKMYTNKSKVSNSNKEVASIFALAFLFLAIGDTGHVGFRVLAYINGGLEQNSVLLGYGKLATSITVTIFYACVVEMWRRRYNKPNNSLIYALFGLSAIRIVIMLLPGNEWTSAEPPFTWEILRNIPLMIVGLCMAFLLIHDAKKANDKTFQWIGITILISYAFYIPVILFARNIPAIGFLMIPKTIAYLAAAFIGYKGLYNV
ncbi:MAG: Brp/Blh family beta-carotene 15,15'-monooxygenase [Xylanivirga thermophila]|jgi:hypothetical protein|uniref:hypothetical protein n=1 Tax=Xylanivirga thermophila TaxID=2496273 RepID=UPI0039F576EA